MLIDADNAPPASIREVNDFVSLVAILCRSHPHWRAPLPEQRQLILPIAKVLLASEIPFG